MRSMQLTNLNRTLASVVRTAAALFLAVWASTIACTPCPNVPNLGADYQEFVASCSAASQPVALEAIAQCSGPDDAGWSNKPRDEGAGPCPPPPNGCTQVVIGRLADTAKYVGCPGYIVLNRSDWTIDLNDQFIACVAACGLGTCDPPAIVVSPRQEIPDFDVDFRQTTVTSRELCELINAGCTVSFADETGPGIVDCACSRRSGG